MNARSRHVITAAVIIVIILLVGATYQGVTTALERRRYPRPGGLVEVGDHQLHIHCTGSGSPTVILEAAALGISASWAWVQPEVAKQTRVCSYDRAGLGWSEAGDRPYDPRRVPEELHVLLGAAGETGPYVLAGHSLGASFVRQYASRYAEEVAAIILIDPAANGAPGDPRFLALSPWLARAGVLRATRVLSNQADGLPDPAAGAVRSFLNRPDHLTRASRELVRWDDAVRVGAEASIPPTVQVITIDTAANGDADDEYFIRGSLFLNDAVAARRAAAGIIGMVERIREQAMLPSG
jgi:pimeloyl-ACP methyl ester carboxylesterase